MSVVPIYGSKMRIRASPPGKLFTAEFTAGTAGFSSPNPNNQVQDGCRLLELLGWVTCQEPFDIPGSPASWHKLGGE
jgi:hypothetical protein